PKFMLYQAPLGLPIIYPTQVEAFVRSLDDGRSRLSGAHRKLARDLFGGQVADVYFDRVPAYDFAGLRKGICCLRCREFLVVRGTWNKLLVCGACGYRESRESGVMRCV